MTNRYDKIPNHKAIKLVMQQELTDKQIEYVESTIKRAALQNDDKACVDFISFNPNQKRKLEQVLKNKGYKFVEMPSNSILISL